MLSADLLLMLLNNGWQNTVFPVQRITAVRVTLQTDSKCLLIVLAGVHTDMVTLAL